MVEEEIVRNQALVAVDKIEEALTDREYQDAAEATLSLSEHIGELQEAG